jgi:V8-like Glu-specific endopeptidase
MASLFDEYPYPWSRRDAQQLYQLMTRAFSTSQAVMQLVLQSNLDPAAINFNQAVLYIWRETFTEAVNQGALRTLVQNAHDSLNTVSPVRKTLATILADRPIEDPEPTTASGKPNFINGSSEISKDEALLYHDDLTLQIGRLPALIKVLQAMHQYSPSVCKLTLDINGHPQFGTAFRIGDDLLLTNWHVLHKLPEETPATAVSAEFGYEDNGAGGILPAKIIECDETSIVADKDDDWGIIRTKTAMDAAWPIIKLSEAAAPKLNTPAYIIQHPNGDRKRLGFVRNEVNFFDTQVVHYITDTQEGSSGAPVFNSAAKLIALHHRGGEPQEVLGRPPVKKNEGIRISRIIEGLTAKNIVFP